MSRETIEHERVMRVLDERITMWSGVRGLNTGYKLSECRAILGELKFLKGKLHIMLTEQSKQEEYDSSEHYMP